jgi:UDP-N-acetylglucosamine--N-acetylmuramyl-(pentapeptide) pyrophosphoryl-undecaprenol N-acetylglucosamine transferase
VTAALAVAEAFRSAHPDGEVLIVGRTGSVEEELVPAAGFRLETILVRGWDRDSLWRNLVLPVVLLWACLRGLRVLGRFRPDVVLGVGAHAMVPCVCAAFLRRVPYVLQVSEPSGLANRLLRRGAAAACVSFPGDVFPTRRTLVTGYPVRGGFARRAPHVPPRRLLIMGGSLGARRINHAVWAALDELLARFEEVVHLTGAQGAERGAALARPGYLSISTSTDVAGLMAATDLVVGRAGLGTCAEVLAVGLPSVLVPGTFGGGHQKRNAALLQAAGAATLISDAEMSGARLLRALDQLTPERLESMANAAARLGRLNAAAAIVRVLDRVAAPARTGWPDSGGSAGSVEIGGGDVREPVREAEHAELAADLAQQVHAEVVSGVKRRPGRVPGRDVVAAPAGPLRLQHGQTGAVVQVAVHPAQLPRVGDHRVDVPLPL